MNKMVQNLMDCNFYVQGMSCTACIATIETAIKNKSGVSRVSISLLLEKATVRYDQNLITSHEILEHVQDIGFDTQLISDRVVNNSADENLMKCSACYCINNFSKHQEEDIKIFINQTDGILSHLFFDGKANKSCELHLIYDANTLRIRKFNSDFDQFLMKKGIKLFPLPGDAANRFRQHQNFIHNNNLIKKITLSVPLSILVWCFSLAEHNGVGEGREGILPWMDWGGGLLTTGVLFLGGKDIIKKGIKNIYLKKYTMECLISLSSLLLYFLSSILLLSDPKRVHSRSFDAVCSLIISVLLGKWLECFVKGRALSSLERLDAATPCRILLANSVPSPFALDGPVSRLPEEEREKETALPGNEFMSPKMSDMKGEYEREIPVESLEIDDVIFVRAGMTFAGDGYIMSDTVVRVNESILRGENKNIIKKKGDAVLKGSICEQGDCYVKITKLGSQSLLGEIIDLIQRADQTKPKIEVLTDTISFYFIPFVFFFSVSTFLFWMLRGDFDQIIFSSHSHHSPSPNNFEDWRHAAPQSRFLVAVKFAVSVLAVACPCALGLASPLANVVSIGECARRGIVIANSNILQSASKIDVAVFDKTGTLTNGLPTVSAALIRSSLSPQTKEKVEERERVEAEEEQEKDREGKEEEEEREEEREMAVPVCLYVPENETGYNYYFYNGQFLTRREYLEVRSCVLDMKETNATSVASPLLEREKGKSLLFSPLISRPTYRPRRRSTSETGLETAADYFSELLLAVSSLETDVSHPIARGLIATRQFLTGDKQLATVRDKNLMENMGVIGYVGENLIGVGNEKLMHWLRTHSPTPSLPSPSPSSLSLSPLPEEMWEQELEAWCNARRKKGEIIVYINKNTHIVGAFSLQDSLRPDTPSTIQALQAKGIQTLICTGDHTETALAIASLLQISPSLVHSNCLPKDKITLIHALQKEKKKVLMIGDGINDAPAMAAADASVSLKTGGGVLFTASECVLMNCRLRSVLEMLWIGERTRVGIYCNLILSFLFNLFSLPVAGGYLYPWLYVSPVLCGVLMSLSSLFVLLSTLVLMARLRRGMIAGRETVSATSRMWEWWSRVFQQGGRKVKVHNRRQYSTIQ